MINADKVSELKKSVDLSRLFEHYGFQIQQKGKTAKALCPFHKETEPSLSINEKTKLWQCFGCGEAGDGISLIQKLEKITFPEAIRKLAEFKGKNADEFKIEQLKAKKAYSLSNEELVNRVRDFYHRVFNERPETKAYLNSRGLTKYFDEYKIGYCDGTLLSAIPRDSEIKEQLAELGILLDNHRERFMNCVIFPIQDENGNTISFYGRHIKMDTGGHFYLPGAKQGIFNLKQLKEKRADTLIITESIIDSYSFIQNEMANVMPIYGINGMTEEMVSLLTELNPEKVLLALDGDERGQNAANELKEKLKRNCEIVTFPKKQDANEYFKTYSKADFEQLFKEKPTYKLELKAVHKQGPTLLEKYQIKYAEVKYGKLNVTVKAENKEKSRFNLDTYNLYSQRHRQNLVTAISELFKQNQSEVEAEVNELILIAEEIVKNPKSIQEELETTLTDAQEQEALAFLKSPNLLDQIVKDYEQIGYIGEEINKKIAYLVMTSRKMDNPLSLVIMSNSAAGKSSLQKATLEFCPEAEAKHFTRLTQQSLYYLGEDTLQHKFLSIEEEEGSSEASYSLKAMLSAKEISVAATDTDQATGKKRATEYKTKGPIAVMISTTTPELEAEFASRTMVISIDESNQQTQNIHEQQKQKRTRMGQKKNRLKEKIIQKHRNAQLLLDSEITVVNEYAPQLEFPTNRLRYRRCHEQYLDLIESMAFLNQHQREIKSDSDIPKYIEVTKEDIKMANEIFVEVMGWTIDELKPPVRKLLNQLFTYTKETGLIRFERREIREKLKLDNMTLHRYLTKLMELDYVRGITAPNGSKHQYELVYDGEGEEGKKFIIGLKNAEELK